VGTGQALTAPTWQTLQHGRVTVRDQERYDRIRSMTDPAHPVTVTHWLTPPGPRNPGNTLPT
jgi:hypothetical protein